MGMKGKWAQGIRPRNFSWVIKDRLACGPRALRYHRLYGGSRRNITPDAETLAQKDETGLRWSYDPDGCCEIRKVIPLKAALAPFDAQFTGRLADWLRRFKAKMDYAEYGGAPLLGVNGLCMISHGRSDSRAIRNALLLAARFTRTRVLEQIDQRLRAL